MNKNDFINNFEKSKLMDFLENDRNGVILRILDNEGTNLLDKSNNKDVFINYILSYSKYANKLLTKKEFLDVLLSSDITYYYASMRTIDPQSYDNLIKRSIETNIPYDIVARLITYFDTKYVLDFLDRPNIPRQLLVELVKCSFNSAITNKIINNYNIDLVDSNIGIRSFFSLTKVFSLRAFAKQFNNEEVNEIFIPTRMINKKLAKAIWREYDVITIRKIIDDISCCTEPEIINNYVKAKENETITNCDESTLYEPIKSIKALYDEYLNEYYNYNVNDNNKDNYFSQVRLRNKIMHTLEKTFGEDEILNLRIDDKEMINEKLHELSDRYISDLIVDYHFEENYYNIMLDIRELLHFYYDGNISIPKERVDLYERLSNIDMLSLEEKKELHHQLKSLNMIELFYEDMALSRHIVNESIKEYSLSKESIKKYRDEKLSKECGVDVFVMDGEPFFGIVKTGIHDAEDMPVGHSYSLVGDGGLAVFGRLADCNTYLYDADDLNPDQIVHVYPNDSFTMYQPFAYSTTSTRRVNTLSLPDELVSSSDSYNEILVLEKGLKDTGINESIPKLQKVALYCLDKISKEAIESAKNNNVGIILISSRKYGKPGKMSLYKYRRSINEWDYNYLNDFYDKGEFKNKR